MSFAQRLWSSTGSADRPMILALRLANSFFIFAMVPSSVVHTGVKSFGWENRMAQPSPIQRWKSIGPSVVSAWKFVAVSPIRNAMGVLLEEANYIAPTRGFAVVQTATSPASLAVVARPAGRQYSSAISLGTQQMAGMRPVQLA